MGSLPYERLFIAVNGRAGLLQRQSRLGAIGRATSALGRIGVRAGDSNMVFIFGEQRSR
jgi:hypothetical protein